jgi:hypothetical protein
VLRSRTGLFPLSTLSGRKTNDYAISRQHPENAFPVHRVGGFCRCHARLGDEGTAQTGIDGDVADVLNTSRLWLVPLRD